MVRALGLSCAVLALLPFAAVAQTSSSAQRTVSPAAETITLQPGDMIRVQIWREEDLSGEFPVDEFGTVVLPLLGEKQVTGIAMRELRDLLLQEYGVQLRNPSISITPLRRINILGEVSTPGLYTVDPTISLAGAIALAGGTTPAGDLNRIRILRSGEVIRERVGAANTLQSADIRSGDQILVEQRGWFERNSTFLVSVALGVPSMILAIVTVLDRTR
ncbi:MAG TPA: polysaccharide biosynthesis/export family protein [Longimicrobiaceae bacterium]|nr:polysaccharide biosynthesis/export family protein [Longimicrobiaceae bacterium]